MNRFLQYLKRLFVGGPEWLKQGGAEIFWPRNPPINSFPISVYCTADAKRIYESRILQAIDEVNDTLGFEVYLKPVPASQDLLQHLGRATMHDAQPNLRGMVLVDVVSGLVRKSTSTIYSATKDYELFGEKVGSIRCASVELESYAEPELKLFIVLHELLHCLGLDHDTETGSIMNEFFMKGYNYYITPKTVEALRRKYPKQT
jgi:hypothetical protein